MGSVLRKPFDKISDLALCRNETNLSNMIIRSGFGILSGIHSRCHAVSILPMCWSRPECIGQASDIMATQCRECIQRRCLTAQNKGAQGRGLESGLQGEPRFI